MMPSETISSIWTTFPTEPFPEGSPGMNTLCWDPFVVPTLPDDIPFASDDFLITIPADTTSHVITTITVTPTSTITIYPSSTETPPRNRGTSSESPVSATVTTKSSVRALPDTSSIKTGLAVITVTTLDRTYLITLQRSTSAASPTTPSTSNATVATTVPGIDNNATTEYNNTTRIALGVSIPLSIILIALLLAGAYLWGKRTSQSFRNAPEEAPAREEKQQGMETYVSSPEVPQELATEFNFAEMFVPEKPQEMAHQTPAKSLDKEVVLDNAEGEGSKTAQLEIVEG